MWGVDTAFAAFAARKERTMTLKIARTSDAPPPATEKKHPGWDPFEVWRTRVLLPRIAESTAATPSLKSTPPTVSLISRKR
jgi:hypothetical protein